MPELTCKIFHIVISTRAPPCPEAFLTMLREIRGLDLTDYCIVTEYGSKGTNPHLDCCIQIETPRRPSALKTSIKTQLKKHLPNITDDELKNIRVIFPRLDPNPLYLVGYSFKENPKQFVSTYSEAFRNEAKEYFNNDPCGVRQQERKQPLATIDKIGDRFVQYITHVAPDHVDSEYCLKLATYDARMDGQHDIIVGFFAWLRKHEKLTLSVSKKVSNRDLFVYASRMLIKWGA